MSAPPTTDTLLTIHKMFVNSSGHYANLVKTYGFWNLHALIEGPGVAVCLGRVAPEEAVGILRSQLALIVQSGTPDLT